MSCGEIYWVINSTECGELCLNEVSSIASRIYNATFVSMTQLYLSNESNCSDEVRIPSTTYAQFMEVMNNHYNLCTLSSYNNSVLVGSFEQTNGSQSNLIKIQLGDSDIKSCDYLMDDNCVYDSVIGFCDGTVINSMNDYLYIALGGAALVCFGAVLFFRRPDKRRRHDDSDIIELGNVFVNKRTGEWGIGESISPHVLDSKHTGPEELGEASVNIRTGGGESERINRADSKHVGPEEWGYASINRRTGEWEITKQGEREASVWGDGEIRGIFNRRTGEWEFSKQGEREASVLGGGEGEGEGERMEIQGVFNRRTGEFSYTPNNQH